VQRTAQKRRSRSVHGTAALRCAQSPTDSGRVQTERTTTCTSETGRLCCPEVRLGACLEHSEYPKPALSTQSTLSTMSASIARCFRSRQAASL
jgi:hypothetical protein